MALQRGPVDGGNAQCLRAVDGGAGHIDGIPPLTVHIADPDICGHTTQRRLIRQVFKRTIVGCADGRAPAVDLGIRNVHAGTFFHVDYADTHIDIPCAQGRSGLGQICLRLRLARNLSLSGGVQRTSLHIRLHPAVFFGKTVVAAALAGYRAVLFQTVVHVGIGNQARNIMRQQLPSVFSLHLERAAHQLVQRRHIIGSRAVLQLRPVLFGIQVLLYIFFLDCAAHGQHRHVGVHGISAHRRRHLRHLDVAILLCLHRNVISIELRTAHIRNRTAIECRNIYPNTNSHQAYCGIHLDKVRIHLVVRLHRNGLGAICRRAHRRIIHRGAHKVIQIVDIHQRRQAAANRNFQGAICHFR